MSDELDAQSEIRTLRAKSEIYQAALAGLGPEMILVEGGDNG